MHVMLLQFNLLKENGREGGGGSCENYIKNNCIDRVAVLQQVEVWFTIALITFSFF